MHKIFGTKENVEYTDREGAYLIPFRGNLVGVIQTYYCGELLEKVGEPTEEDHTLCWVEYDELKGKLFVEMQNWALEQIKYF